MMICYICINITNKRAFCNIDNILIGNFRHLQMIKDWVTVEGELEDGRLKEKDRNLFIKFSAAELWFAFLLPSLSLSLSLSLQCVPQQTHDKLSKSQELYHSLWCKVTTNTSTHRHTHTHTHTHTHNTHTTHHTHTHTTHHTHTHTHTHTHRDTWLRHSHS